MKKEIDRFKVRADDGREFTLVERQEQTCRTLMSGKVHTVLGARDWVTACGTDATPADAGGYHILYPHNVTVKRVS